MRMREFFQVMLMILQITLIILDILLLLMLQSWVLGLKCGSKTCYNRLKITCKATNFLCFTPNRCVFFPELWCMLPFVIENLTLLAKELIILWAIIVKSPLFIIKRICRNCSLCRCDMGTYNIIIRKLLRHFVNIWKRKV